MLKKRVKRYVDQVVSYLPILERRKARAIITASIYARLEDLTMGKKPTRLDLRSVLYEMGTPESLADAYYEDFHVPFYERVDLWRVLEMMIRVIFAASLCLIVSGMCELVLGVQNLQGLMTGLVLGTVVVFYRMLMQMRTTIPADSR